MTQKVQTIQKAPEPREATFVIAGGMKKVGKTYQTLMEINRYLRNTRRKVLIFDVNNEYGNVQADHNSHFTHVRAIDIKELAKWTLNGIPEIRRILPVNLETGQPLSNEELMGLLDYVLANFKNGALVLEDLTKIVSDSIGMSLIGMLSTNRHASVDVFIHFQTIQKIVNPKMWGLSNVIRLHKCEDTVEKHHSKIPNSEGLYICENLIEIINKKNGNNRACVWFIKEENRVKGPFTKNEFIEAVEMYLQDNIKVFNKELKRINLKTGEKIYNTQTDCYNALMNKYIKENYGNPN